MNCLTLIIHNSIKIQSKVKETCSIFVQHNVILSWLKSALLVTVMQCNHKISLYLHYYFSHHVCPSFSAYYRRLSFCHTSEFIHEVPSTWSSHQDLPAKRVHPSIQYFSIHVYSRNTSIVYHELKGLACIYFT